jgi:DNA-binding NtrC family response regulator
MKAKTIIFLEDDEPLRRYYTIMLEQHGYRVVQDMNSSKILTLIEQHQPDLLISDLVMPEHEGVEGIMAILGKYRLPIIAISSHAKYLQAVSPLVQCTLHKPFSVEELTSAVQRLLQPAQQFAPSHP